MLKLNLSGETKYLPNMQIYTSHNRKQQRKSPGACAVFTDSNNAETVGGDHSILLYTANSQGHYYTRPPSFHLYRSSSFMSGWIVVPHSLMLQHYSQSPATGAPGSLSLHVGLSSFSFYPICHWGSDPSLCSLKSVLTSLKVLEGGKVGTLTFYLDCVEGTLYLFNWSRPPWLRPLPFENFHTQSPAFIMTSQSEPWWLLRASALHTKLVCTKLQVSLSQSICGMFGVF